MARDCQAVASKLERGQLKITKQSKRTQTGHYLLDIDTACAGTPHLPRELLWQPRRTKAVQTSITSQRVRQCRCHRKADTLLNSISADPSQPLKRSKQRKRKELRLVDWGTHPWMFPFSPSFTWFVAFKTTQCFLLHTVWCPWRIISRQKPNKWKTGKLCTLAFWHQRLKQMTAFSPWIQEQQRLEMVNSHHRSPGLLSKAVTFLFAQSQVNLGKCTSFVL